MEFFSLQGSAMIKPLLRGELILIKKIEYERENVFLHYGTSFLTLLLFTRLF